MGQDDYMHILRGCLENEDRRPKTKDLEKEDPLENEDLETEDPLENEDLRFLGGLRFRGLRFLGGLPFRGLRFLGGLPFRDLRFLGGLPFRGPWSSVFGLRSSFSRHPILRTARHAFGKSQK